MADKNINSRTIKGMLVNLNAGLLLPFMLNPRPITHNKSVSWDIEEIPGLPAPIHYYQSGGQKVISFELFYDSSASAVSTGHYNTVDPTGVIGIESILESFLYPQFLDLGVGSGTGAALKQNKFVSPPAVYLVLGLRFWKGYLISAPMEETKFNRDTLLPTQFTTTIEFSVLEEGIINQINTAQRNALALVKSSLNLSNIVQNSVQEGFDVSSFNFVISLA